MKGINKIDWVLFSLSVYSIFLSKKTYFFLLIYILHLLKLWLAIWNNMAYIQNTVIKVCMKSVNRLLKWLYRLESNYMQQEEWQSIDKKVMKWVGRNWTISILLILSSTLAIIIMGKHLYHIKLFKWEFW